MTSATQATVTVARGDASQPGGAVTQALSDDERSACAVLADSLAASRVVAALSPILCLATLAAVVWHPVRSSAVLGAEGLVFPLVFSVVFLLVLLLLLLALMLAERVLASRVELDARLFDRLADGRLADLAALDAGLRQVFDIPEHKRGRPLAPRLAGASRLQRWHFGVVAALLVLAVATSFTYQLERTLQPTTMLQTLLNALAVITGQAIRLFSLALTGVRPLWIGSLPQATQRVYFANHCSHGDFVLIWTTLPGALRRRTRPVAGRDYWETSALRRFIGGRVFKALLIDRLPPPGAPSPVDEMAAALQRGESLILFPEGTRNTTDAPMLPFKSGLFHLSRQCPNVELVPVWIDNIRRVIPKGQWLPVPMVCSVSYGAPLVLDTDEDKDHFLQRAQAAVRALQPSESLATS